MVSGDTCDHDKLGVLMCPNLRILHSKIVEDSLANALFFRIQLLRSIICNLRSSLIATSPRRQEDYRRQKIISSEGGDQFWRRDFRACLIHAGIIPDRRLKSALRTGDFDGLHCDT